MISKKNRFDIYYSGRFGDMKTPVLIKRQDTSFQSVNSTNDIFGLEYARTLWRPNRKFECNLLAGIGSEHRSFFNYINNNLEVDNEPNDIINSRLGDNTLTNFYFSGGLEFKYFIMAGGAINISPRYLQSGDFNRKGIVSTPLNGGSLLLNVGLSFFVGGHPNRNNRRFWNLMQP